MDLLRSLLYGVSAQRPSHSIFVGGEMLPLEARMGGIFLGFLWAIIVLAMLGRLRAARAPGETAALACWGLIALMALDGLNAVLADGGFPHLYPPNSVMRLLTGLGAGFGLAILALPVAAQVAWKTSEDEAPFEDLTEVGAALVPLLVLAALMLLDIDILLWPIAIAMVLGVLAAFGVANLFVLALFARRSQVVRAHGDLFGSPVAALGIALLEVALLGALRGFMASQGATWGF